MSAEALRSASVQTLGTNFVCGKTLTAASRAVIRLMSFINSEDKQASTRVRVQNFQELFTALSKALSVRQQDAAMSDTPCSHKA